MGRGVDKGSRGRKREKTVKNGGGVGVGLARNTWREEKGERGRRGQSQKRVRIREWREADQSLLQQARRTWLLLGNCRVELPGRA